MTWIHTLELLALVAGILVCAEVLRRRVRAYRFELGYDARADHRFRFDPAFCRSIDLAIDDSGIELPAFVEGDHSAFLELTVSTSVAGLIADPFVETRLNDDVLRHYVERGGAGRRFLNVSALIAPESLAAGRLTLRGVRLRWLAAAGARLHVLGDAQPPPGKVLVLAPHPDDAEIAAFGLFSRHPSWVVTVTVGDAGPNLYAGYFQESAAAYDEKARMRVWDSLNIPYLAARPPLQTVNLGYFDGTLETMRQSPDQPVKALLRGETDISRLRMNPLDAGQPPREATWRNLVADMRALLLEIRPTAIVMPHLTIDPHADHRCTSLALLEALADQPDLRGKLLFYANHLPVTELYPVGSSDGTVSIPPLHDDSVQIGTILSLPLDAPTRLRKRIALETHHDLRPPLQTGERSLTRVFRDALMTTYTHLVQPDIDYVRRAVRPNELFLVVGFEHARRLLRAD